MCLEPISLVVLGSLVFYFGLVKYFRRIEGLRTTAVLQTECKEKKCCCSEQEEKMSELANVNDVPMKIRNHRYPAKEHNLRVKDLLLTRNSRLSEGSTAFFIAGEELEGNKYCDTTREFRQNRYFYHLSGVDIPASALLFNCNTDKLTLFLPDIDEEDVMWSGMPLSLDEAVRTFDVDEALYISDLESKFKGLQNFTIFTTDLDNVRNKDIEKLLTPSDPDFFYAMDETRVIKDWYEIETIRKACQISDKSHLAVMSALPIELNELQLQAEFEYHATRQGGRSLGYDPICCSGPACGTLHYVKNSEDIKGKHSILIDAGAEWKQYTSDITRCFPTSGKFTKEHREAYETVLDMQDQAMRQIKPGANWDDLHALTHKVLIKHFLRMGIFKKEFSEDEIFKRRASCAFYPHGLGHMLGLDVHDVGGNPNYDDPDPMFRYLRIRRTLKENMVVTNEPGCYFNQFLIREFLEKYPERLELVDMDVLKKYMYVGGVRIEDDILVTRDGYENLTGITSDPVEIERIVQKGLKKTRSGFHVIV
ncbi:AIS_HP2_G0016230.mRNA.1.CDS.1 [Saccharomyces cerevisiae]|nr:AIS_HP2_G0016230.mRNA.1.CDS.1 [Saccharomyces cerevisiae]CAI6488696.1 AIS_HP2_G0016230.mRNA.1.CDS.1 [Saccharomyces cerevisiae]